MNSEKIINILIIHNTINSQFENLALFLARNPFLRVYYLTREKTEHSFHRLHVRHYDYSEKNNYLPLEKETQEGLAVIESLKKLRNEEGFVPDIVIGTAGWGALLFIKDLYPDVRLVGYFEWFYHASGSDVAFWPDEIPTEERRKILRLRNAYLLVQLDACDVGYTPMNWQKAQFPKEYRDSIHVIHEGVDTGYYAPAPGTKMVLPGLDLSDAKEVVTYVTRGMEPYRGFPNFMEAVKILQKHRPECEIVIAGNDRTIYGRKPGNGKTWKEIELEKGGLDLSRIHFTGWLSRNNYRRLLQASTVHVYLTRPFVLSWSMVQSMSAGCCLVSSRTPPVEEVVTDHENGLLADFRSPQEIAGCIEEALDDEELRRRLSEAARNTIMQKYSLQLCLQKQMDMIFGKND